LTRSGLTYPEVSSKVCHDSFWQLGNSVSLPWVSRVLKVKINQESLCSVRFWKWNHNNKRYAKP